MGMAYFMSLWSAKITTKPGTSFVGRVTRQNWLQFKYYILEGGVYQTFFAGGGEEARAALARLESSPNFLEDINALQEHVENRSQIEALVDGVGDYSNNLYRAVTGREELKDLSSEELQNLNPDSLQDPIIQERLMDLINDQMNASEDGKAHFTGSIALDRLGFNTSYNLASIPVNMALSMATFQAVCMNLDNPAAALAAFSALQMTRQNTAGYIYFRTREDVINQ
jgi:hypothetical protein